MFGEVVVPVLLKGQVSLLGVGHHLPIPQHINLDFWWVEAAHVTDDYIVLAVLPRKTAVDLNLRRRCQDMM